MDRILAIILGLPAALLLVYYRRSVGDFIGQIDFAEKYLGGTYNLVLILALLVFIGSLMYAFGTLQTLLGSTVGGYF